MAVQRNHQIIFLVFCLTYGVIGLAMVGYGGASIAKLLSFGFFTQATFLAGASIFVAIGAFKIFLAIFGVITALVKNRWLMGIFSVIFIVLMLWTFIAAIYGFLARPSAYSTVQSRLTEAFTNNSTVYAADINNLQTTLDCCGLNGVKEGCNTTRGVDKVYGQGCEYYLSDLVVEELYNVGALGMAFGVFEITSMLIAMQNMDQA